MPGVDALRLVVHDYAGHPFQVQLSRALAQRGHDVLHLYFHELQTPKGNLQRRADDPASFAVEGIRLGQPFRKQSLLRRRQQELAYAARAGQRLAAFAPDAVLSANTPLEVQRTLMRYARAGGARFVIWMQDFYCIAVKSLLTKRFGLPGRLVGAYYRWLERRLMQASDQIVFITHDFLEIARGWGIAPERCHVIENWAPLDEFAPQPRENPWRARHGLSGKLVILYSGTIGMKHSPSLLLALAEAWQGDERVRVVVVSEGPGRAWLERARAERGLANLVLLDYQPYEDLPQVLASGDLLVAVLDRDAGAFAVPSKVLSYLCAARPLLLAVPRANLAARTVTAAGAGIVVEPDDTAGLVEASRGMVDNIDLRETFGLNARKYAEQHFEIKNIAARFELVLDKDLARRVPLESAAVKTA